MMHPQHRTAIFLLWLSLLFLVGAQSDPESSITYFNNRPAGLVFLDDTQTALFVDPVAKNLHVSLDEGKSWNQASGIPSGVVEVIYEHPFDNRYAFALTAGKTHYRTEDRGQTWRSFDVPLEPSTSEQVLSFHSDPTNYGYILYQGETCKWSGWSLRCESHTYYTRDAFSSEPKELLLDTVRCQFAHSTKDFKHDADPNLIYCVGHDTSSDSSHGYSHSSRRLFSSTDFFQNNKKLEDLGGAGGGKGARGVIGLAIVSKFAVVALKDLSHSGSSHGGSSNGDMLLYVSVDAQTWAQAKFPHASSAKLREGAYTIVESTTHSLGVDVLLTGGSASAPPNSPMANTVGTLFISNSNGTYFVESLRDTNRNIYGFVDYESVYGVDGVGIANVVANARDVENMHTAKRLRSMITFDDGSSWAPLRAPAYDADGQRIGCNVEDSDACALHLHSVTDARNPGRVFSSPAPGFVMGVGSVGPYLRDYEECDTFLSTDGGTTWKMVHREAHKYEFGDQGSVLVIVNDEEGTDVVRYSVDLGKTWKTYNLGIKVRAQVLTTIPDNTSQKFVLIAQLPRSDSSRGRYAVIFLDFARTRTRQCTDSDFETWYARSHSGHECVMGHKQSYRRRKPDADCYVGKKFEDPVEQDENCECTDEDFECDFNYVRSGNDCIPVGPEPIPAGTCSGHNPNQMYQGSSGWRKVSGNTCQGGLAKDEKVLKKCSEAQVPEGEVMHQTFEFSAGVMKHAYFKNSQTILVYLNDRSIWQSGNEGYTWNQLDLEGETKFINFLIHAYADDRAYLITDSARFLYTTDGGRTWNPGMAPGPPSTFGAEVLRFHPSQSDHIIWVSDKDCDDVNNLANCHAEAHYSLDNGRNWYLIDIYVQNCAWARDSGFKVDETEIICESYKTKQGSQLVFFNNPLELVSGRDFYRKKQRLFANVIGFTRFSEYLVVAERLPAGNTLDLQVSLDGMTFSTGQFPPGLRPESNAFTILESTTDALFIHVTTSDWLRAEYGHIVKSNSNGTYFGFSLENVNRNRDGYVDFEKLIGLDGIALANVVANPGQSQHTGIKELQSRITHNDGASWKSLSPPQVDSEGNPYECSSTKCALHIHGYSERRDPRSTYSSPAIPGVIIAVGNVGESLAPYMESGTFFSRDAGFTWEEVHKDAHLWEFGDSGSIIVIVNDEDATDHVLYTLDEGKTWRQYVFSSERMRIMSLTTMPEDLSRRFILFAIHPRTRNTVAVHLDFSSLTSKQCEIDLDDPGNDDFELWSPSEVRTESCLFGRRTYYHRRRRDVNCVVGNQPKAEEKTVENCQCTDADFECEFNHVRDAEGKCVLVPGLEPLSDDDSCRNGESEWYSRTAYRKMSYSSCEGGKRPDRGAVHSCPGLGGHSGWFWFFVIMLPFAFTALIAFWYYRRMGVSRGTIRLPGGGDRYQVFRGDDSGIMSTLASIPWFLVGLAGIAYEAIASRVEQFGYQFNSRRGYRNLPVDEDAQILRFEDEEE